jgi:hypothetical protein
MSVMRSSSLAALSLLVAVVAAAAVGLPRAAPSPSAMPSVYAAAPLPPLLGIVGKGEAQELARIDPDTLRAQGRRRVVVGFGGCASRSGGQACWTLPPWSFAPHQRLLALARNDQAVARSLRIVDVRRMRVRADVPLAGGAVGMLAWLAPRRVLMVQEICCKERQQLVAVDLARRNVVARQPLTGSVQRVGRTARELVLLVTPAKDIGTARLAVADRSGAMRSVRLERMPAGVKLLPGEDFRVEQSVPGLAVDARGRRAFVVAAGLVAEVDLVTLAVTYHEPKPATSALSRLLDWVDPPAYAKGASGPTRTARWLGGGLLAVTGADEDLVEDARGQQQSRLRAAGLDLIDTRDWSVRTIDTGASEVRLAGERLLATGSSWDPATRTRDAIGLAAYGFDGRTRFHLFDGREVWIREVYRGRAYVDIQLRTPPWSSLRVVRLDTGRAIRRARAAPLPWLLLETASGRWDV